MFEKASRLKLRFDSPKGLLAVEDLWDIPLQSDTGKTNVDDVARAINAKLKSDEAVSFVDPGKASNELDQLKLDIVKHIITVRLAERERKRLERERAAEKEELIAILADKQREGRKAMTEDEIKARIAAL